MFSLTRQCYLCLSSTQSLVKATQCDTDGIPFIDKLNYCAINLVLVVPASRVQICKTCYTILKVSYEFKRTCSENNEKLTNYQRLLSKDSGVYSDLLVMLDDKAFLEHHQESKQTFNNNAANSKKSLKRKKDNENSELDSPNIALTKSIKRTENATLQCNEIKEDNCLPQQQIFVKVERLNYQLINDFMEQAERNRKERVIKVENLDEFLPNLNKNDVLFIDYSSRGDISSISQTSTEIIDVASLDLSNFDEISSNTNSSNNQEYLDNIKDSPIDFNDNTILDDEEKLNYEKLLDSLRKNKTDSNNEAMEEHATILIDSMKEEGEEEEEITSSTNNEDNYEDTILSQSSRKSTTKPLKTKTMGKASQISIDSLKKSKDVALNNEAISKDASILSKDSRRSRSISSKTKSISKDASISSDSLERSIAVSSNNETSSEDDTILSHRSRTSRNTSSKKKLITNNSSFRRHNFERSLPVFSSNEDSSEDDIILSHLLRKSRSKSSKIKPITKDSPITSDSLNRSLPVSSINEDSSEDDIILSHRSRTSRGKSSKTN